MIVIFDQSKKSSYLLQPYFSLPKFMICGIFHTHRSIARDGNCNSNFFSELPGPKNSKSQKITQNYGVR